MDNESSNSVKQVAEPSKTTNPQSQATAPISAKPVKSSKILIIILSILLVLSLGAAATFAYLYFNNNIQNTSVPTSAPDTVPETPISSEIENNPAISISQVESLLKDKYKFDTSTMVIYDGWHKYIENLDRSNKILFTIYRAWNENKFRSEQSTDSCDPIIYNIGFNEFNDLYIYYFGDTEPLERKDYQFDSLVTTAIYNSNNDGFDIYFPNCIGGYSTERLLSKVDKVANTDDGFKATVLAVTLDSVVREDAKEVLGPGIIDGVEYYEISMTDDVLEKIRNSLSAYEFNFIDDNGEYKLVSIEKI